MGITAITIENFKGIQEPVRVELKPITLLFGPNSAGKSTIVQALHYAREIFERQNLDPDRTLLGGDSVDLGGFESLVHRHDRSLPVILRFDLDLTNEDLPTYSYGDTDFSESMLINAPSYDLWKWIARVKTASVEIRIKWSEQINSPYIEKYAVRMNGAPLLEIESTPDSGQIQLKSISAFNPIFLDGVDAEEAIEDFKEIVSKMEENESEVETSTSDSNEYNIGEFWPFLFDYIKIDDGVPGLSAPIAISGQTSALPVWGKTLDISKKLFREDLGIEDEPNVVGVLSSLVVGPGELVRNELQKLCYLGPIRQVPTRSHTPLSSPEESRWANGLAAYDTLFISDDAFIEKVNEWLTQEDRFDSGYRVEVKKYMELSIHDPIVIAALQDRILDEEVDLKKTFRELPVKRRLVIRDEKLNIELTPQDIGVGISQVLPVVVAALHNKTGIVAIEQPELHIHPAFQVTLGDLFIEQVRLYPDLTFILETHSEHLMLRFLRRIRETGEQEAPENRTLTPTDLSIYYVEQGEAGISCLPIRVDEEGDFLDHWPKGFFAERAEELF